LLTIKNNSKLTSAAIVSGMLCASVAGTLAIRRYLFLKDLKEELGSIPWDTKDVTWKHYFKSYLRVEKAKPIKKEETVMGFFNSLVGRFKPSGEAPKEEEEVSDCCVNGQCVCGESSFTENEGTTAPITVINTTTTATSNISDDVANLTMSDSGDVNPAPITEIASITKPRPAVKNEVTTETQVEESSTEEKFLQLEFNLSDTVETEAPVPVVIAPTSSLSGASTGNKVRKSKLKKAKKKKSRNT
jgi:hypothetical protein